MDRDPVEGPTTDSDPVSVDQLIRAFDVQATNLQRQGQLALWPPSFGQEAAQVGSARAARTQDHLFPSYREHAVTMHRGVEPMEIIAMYRDVLKP